MNNSIKKLAKAKADKATNRTDSAGRSGMGATRPKYKGVSQTASTRIPGGALDSNRKIGIYKVNRETGREDLVGSASRSDSAMGLRAKLYEQKYGHKIDKVRIQDRPYSVNYVSVGKRNPAKTTPRGIR